MRNENLFLFFFIQHIKYLMVLEIIKTLGMPYYSMVYFISSVDS